MALVHLTRDIPEKGYKVTEMDCQEEFVEKMTRRGWKVSEKASKKEEKKEEKKDDFKFTPEKKAEPEAETDTEKKAKKVKTEE